MPIFAVVKHVVVIGFVIPEPASTAAGHRMMQLIDLFLEFGFRVTFLSAATNLEFSEKIAVEKIEINSSVFDEKIRELKQDIVLFDRYITEEQFGWRVADCCPEAIKILDTEDLHFLREARRKAFFEARPVEKKDFVNDIFKREIGAILRCDLSLIISEFEYHLLTNEFKIDPEILFYIPFLAGEFEKKTKMFAERKHFVSIGNFLHEPNWQTVLELKHIWKDIRQKLPHVQLHIYGAYAGQKVLDLNSERDGFLVKGRADSVEEVFSRARVLLAPIPFGAGLKGKLWQSMIFGLPNVTTEIGAEGMHRNLSWNGFVAEDKDSFANCAVELYSDEKLWQASQKHGYEILGVMFNKEQFAGAFFQKIESMTSNLDSHRIENYLGIILQHHQHNSTKYMSRWIEEKKRK